MTGKKNDCLKYVECVDEKIKLIGVLGSKIDMINNNISYYLNILTNERLQSMRK